jgi:rod shape-determining protein MreD
MPQNSPSAGFVVLASLVLAMILRIVPLPHAGFVVNPDWVLLFLAYWAIAIPDRVGVGYAWFIGLFSDALTGRMLGQHALAYSVAIYLCARMHRQLRVYPVYQQAFYILLLLLLEELLVFWTQDIKAASAIGMDYWLPAFTGATLWPIVFWVLRWLRRCYRIS